MSGETQDLVQKKPEYTVKVDRVIAGAQALKFTQNDFADLAVAAADQAGLNLAQQNYLRKMLRVPMVERATTPTSTGSRGP